MHELSLAEELVARCAQLAGGRSVTAVRARCSSAVDCEKLLAAFSLATTATDGLQTATLELEPVPARIDCLCGFTGYLGPEDVVWPNQSLPSLWAAQRASERSRAGSA